MHAKVHMIGFGADQAENDYCCLMGNNIYALELRVVKVVSSSALV